MQLLIQLTFQKTNNIKIIKHGSKILQAKLKDQEMEIKLLKKLRELRGSNYMKMIDECTHLSEKQEMLVEQMCTDIADVIESEGVFYE